MADNVAMRDYGSNSKTMRTTDMGTAHIPHNINHAQALTPTLSAPAVDSLVLSAVGNVSFIECDVHALADGYLFIFDLAAKPANGARTPIVVPKFVPSGSWLNIRPFNPYLCANGLVLAFSSTLNTAGAWNFTALAQAILSGQVGTRYGSAS